MASFEASGGDPAKDDAELAWKLFLNGLEDYG